jgi:hypothetical protein
MNAKELKLRKLIGGFLVLAVAVPCVASAEPLPNMAAGEIDAIVTFCSRLDPRLEDEAGHVRTTLVNQSARSSAEYRQGYDLVSDALARIDRKQALDACGAGKGGHAR